MYGKLLVEKENAKGTIFYKLLMWSVIFFLFFRKWWVIIGKQKKEVVVGPNENQ